jgi:hypothetical protein
MKVGDAIKIFADRLGIFPESAKAVAAAIRYLRIERENDDIGEILLKYHLDPDVKSGLEIILSWGKKGGIDV